MRWLLLLLAVLLAVLQYRLWLGEGGLRSVAALQRAIAAQAEENARLAERNRRLAAEVMDLKEGVEAIEERARSELGMIGPGETFFQVVAPEAEDGR
ncbi:cell division protein FtsB [Inmirania thermothiophila]|uniref:Cell division protein FtsB n=1 Tax=Inmirania thermothiophila TaxID=1750597 RepID=A0A3N1Y064_9GAMM|nr:cell division protein FtsB [Inmirania thermothiophila]ROR32235.1 cell division protein FtsB [Inmirania thermothiophila]